MACLTNHTRMEELVCFQEVDPNTQRRPDISILPGTLSRQKIILDISITNPIQAANANNTTPRETGKQAQVVYMAKMNKYSAIATANDLDFKPIVYESTGLLHTDARNFFLAVAKAAELYRNIASSTLFNYLLTSLRVLFIIS